MVSVLRVCDNSDSFLLCEEDSVKIGFVGATVDKWAVEKMGVDEGVDEGVVESD